MAPEVIQESRYDGKVIEFLYEQDFIFLVISWNRITLMKDNI